MYYSPNLTNYLHVFTSQQHNETIPSVSIAWISTSDCDIASIVAPVNQMPLCTSIKSPASSISTNPPPCDPDSDLLPSRGTSTDATPRSAVPSSPFDLQREYNHALQSYSYNEMWTHIQHIGADYEDHEVSIHHQEYVQVTRERVLHPNLESVLEALRGAKDGKMKHLVTAYFEESEKISNVFLLLWEDVHWARAVYSPLLDFLSASSSADLTEQQCRQAHEIFIQFDRHFQEKSFLSTDPDAFKSLHDCFSKLKKLLDDKIKKSEGRANFIRHATSRSGLCLIGAATVLVVAAVAATAHFGLATAAAPCVAGFMSPGKLSEKETARAKKLKAAANVAYVVDEHLKSISSLIEHLENATKGHKSLIQMGLERDSDLYPVKLVVERLRRNPTDILQLLNHLQVDICLCFTTVNKARKLLQEICCPESAAP